MTEIFNEYAQYYDLLYQDKNYREEVDFIITLIKNNAKAPVKNILNLGCGTGNHDKFLVKNGYLITGVDFSAGMIKAAVDKGLENVTFIQEDISQFKLPQKFDIVLSLYHVMSYLVTMEQLDATLQTVKKHLSKDGIFIFDFWYGPTVKKTKPTDSIKRIENEKYQPNTALIRQKEI